MLAPATLVEDSPNDRQPSATRVHMIPLLHRKKERPHVDPIQSPVYDLHKIWDRYLVKNHIVSTIPNYPKQSTNSYTNLGFSLLINPFNQLLNKLVTFDGGEILYVK
jgi:hypothetical protein